MNTLLVTIKTMINLIADAKSLCKMTIQLEVKQTVKEVMSKHELKVFFK